MYDQIGQVMVVTKTKAAEVVHNQSKWEEYWDDAAQATYWYNVENGEATWIKPADVS